MLYLCAHRVSKCTHVPIFFCVHISCGIYLYLLIDNIDNYIISLYHLLPQPGKCCVEYWPKQENFDYSMNKTIL